MDVFSGSLRYTHNKSEADDGVFRTLIKELKTIQIEKCMSDKHYVANFYGEKEKVLMKIRC
jgi:hypothetical protein